MTLAFLILAAAVCFAAEHPVVEWTRVSAETTTHFSSLLRIDTSNPPGNESKAVAYLKGVLEAEGIEVKTFALDPARMNLVARLKGNGTKRPILLMGHTDVVGVQGERWTVDPFAAIRKDGFIYGRGATDDKDNLTAGLMVLLLLKRSKVALDRDVIFLAEAGEESSTNIGIDFMVREHWPAIDAEFALAEGWGGISRKSKVVYMGVATTEKIAMPLRLVAKGEAGHGSMPRLDNAILRLSRAVVKAGDWQTPVRLNETTREYFSKLASISSPDDAGRYKAVLDPANAGAADKYFAAHEIEHASLLRTSVSPNILKAGFRSNVIPSEAEATLDVRLLPDENLADFIGSLKKVIGDPKIEVMPPVDTGRPASPPSRLDTVMYKALEAAQKRIYPEAITLPQMMTGGTDMAQLRAKGVQAYGIGPIADEEDRYRHGAHSDDERIEELALHKFVRMMWDVVVDVAATPERKVN